jgi:hypothetical protein
MDNDTPNQHAITIEFRMIPQFDDLASLEAIAEALVLKNQVFFENYTVYEDIDKLIANEQIRYEQPRLTSDAQVVGDAARVLDRLHATCLDFAALVAGLSRARGRNARVVVVPLMTPYGEMPNSYHALVESDSGLVDVCVLLKGYPKKNERLLPQATVGTCCIECAYDGTLADKPSCSGCDTGTCGLSHTH